MTSGLSVASAIVWLWWHQKQELQHSSRSIDAASPAPAIVVRGGKPTTNVSAPTDTGVKERKEAQITLSYLTPISIDGKVVDENGAPVPGATVQISIADKPLQTGTEYIQTTDGGGLFSLSGVRGIAFSVTASKAGYYTTSASKGHRNVVVPGNDDTPQSSKDRPIMLVLRRQGQTVPLIFLSNRQIEVPQTGQPITIDLATGRTDQGDLHVTSWVGDDSQRPFDWRYELSVSNGGLVERKGQFDFEAPANGYQATMEINMPVFLENWSARTEKQYFVKFADGKYARFLIRLYPNQKRNFVVIESYLNPAPGNRNLEFDPRSVDPVLRFTP